MSKDKPGLSDAYALKTPDDSRRLYATWAATYDDGFAGAQDYLLPGHVALAFAGAGGQGPVIDIGAGTGLLGQHLARLGIGPVDGIDISPEMLDLARGKGCYRDLVVADMTDAARLPDGAWQGVVSSGTFTVGHLGPDALPDVIRLAAPGAIIALSIFRPHYEAAGFAQALAALSDRIEVLRLDPAKVYGPRADAAHQDHVAMILTARRR